ncbi:MAG: DNA primase [Magnetococcales bacterium]|nr:DNA primase [Magnetococcales bacterium]
MAHYPDGFIEEVRERANLLDVVGRYVHLKKQGANWLGLCPFHGEKTPSFNVRPDQGFYKCFGCGVGGDVFDFLIRLRGMGFAEAVGEVATGLGMTLPVMGHEDAQQQQRRAERQQLLAVIEKARLWFHQRLHAPEGGPARAYLQRRGLQAATIERFGLGYAPPGWRNLLDHFGGGKNAEVLLEKVGLVVPGENRPGYDRFRERIVFPIRDHAGHCIGFGGRLLAQGEPKYINSPETVLYRKGEVLYGLDQAQTAIQRDDRVVVVEGYLDLIALADRGVEAVVATLGTALTAAHLRQLWKRTRRICFCFDGDKAGKKAAWRALEMVLDGLQADRHAHFLFLPDGEDPDDVVRREGAAGFRTRLENATPLMAFFLRQLSEGLDQTSPEGRVAIFHRARPLLAKVADPLLRELYHERLSQYLNLPQHPSIGEEEAGPVGQPLPPSPGIARHHRPRQTTQVAGRDFEQALVALLLRSPDLLLTWEEELSRLDLENPHLAALLSALLTLGSALVDGSAAPLWQRLPTAALVAQAEAILATEEVHMESLPEEFAGCLISCQLRHLNRQIDQKSREIAAGSGDNSRQFGVLLALKQEKRLLQQRKSHPVTRQVGS